MTGKRAAFSELRLAIPEMSDRMLSERLRELEAEGIVERTVLPDVPVRIEYALTDKGRALQAALDAIGKRAERWISAEEAAARAPERPHRVTRAAATPHPPQRRGGRRSPRREST